MTHIPGTHEPGYEPAPLLHDKAATAAFRQVMFRVTGFESDAEAWSMGATRLVTAREPAGANGELLWHMTISCEDRHPSWDEIKTARYRLLPAGLCFGLLLPPPQFYVNVVEQDHVFHLWEITDPRQPWTSP